MRNASGEMFGFGSLVEFTLSCGAWESKTPDELNAMGYSLYLTNSYGELGKAQTLFQYRNGHPALFFSSDRLGDLLLTRANETELARLTAEREEQDKLAAEKEQQEQAAALEKEQAAAGEAGGVQNNGNANGNTNLNNQNEGVTGNQETPKEEVKEEVITPAIKGFLTA